MIGKKEKAERKNIDDTTKDTMPTTGREQGGTNEYWPVALGLDTAVMSEHAW